MPSAISIAFSLILILSFTGILYCLHTISEDSDSLLSVEHPVTSGVISQAERDVYLQSIQSAYNKITLYTTLIFLFFSIINAAVILFIVFYLLSKKDKDIIDRLTKVEKEFVEQKETVKNILSDFKKFADRLDVDMCRALYGTSITNKLYDQAFEWGIRVVYNENLREDKRSKIIESYISNIYNVTEELTENPHEYIKDINTFRDIVCDKIHVLVKLSECDYISEKYRNQSLRIYNDISYILSLYH